MSNIKAHLSLTNVAIFISALIGSGIAALTDLQIKGTDGAVVKLQTTLGVLGMGVHPISAALLLMILGAALCFVFQPKSRKAGFAVGLSVVSVIMTGIPIDKKSTPAGVVLGPTTSLDVTGPYALLPKENVASDWLVFRVQGQPNLRRLNFDVNVKDIQPRPLGKITIRVREVPSGKIWEWTTEQFEQQTNFPVQFFYEIPLSAGTASVEARLEAEHYIAATEQSKIAAGANHVKLSFALEKSPLPNFLKRLFEQRDF